VARRLGLECGLSLTLKRARKLEEKPHLIFIASRVAYPPATGHYLRTLRILQGLSEHFAVHFFGFHDKEGRAADYARAEQVLRSFCTDVHVERLGAERSRVHLLADLVSSVLALEPLIAAKYRSHSMRRAIQRVLDSCDVAAAHADSLPSGQYVVDLPCAKLLTNHNVEHLRLSSYASVQRSWWLRLALHFQAGLTKRYERKLLRQIGNCVVVSEADKRELLGLAPETTFFVVHNGADTSAPPLPPAPPCDAVALWVGGMNDPYNLEAVRFFALEILPRVRVLVPRFRWRVVGREPPQLLVDLAGNPTSGVEVAGFVNNLRDEYARATIVVVPLTTGSGTKLKVLEAMAMGRAIVTTRVGAEGICARDGVEMEIASSSEDFAHRIVKLLADPQRCERMAMAARALAEKMYDWSVVNRQMLSAVQSVMDANSERRQSTECAR